MTAYVLEAGASLHAGYPAIKEYLFKWKAELTPKKNSPDSIGRKAGKYKWYEIQDDVAYYPIFESPKIIFPDQALNPDPD